MKTREFEMLVHTMHNGTNRSPVVGIDTVHGKLWGKDESHLRRQIKYVFGCKAVFSSRKLDDTPIAEYVLKFITK